MRKNILLLLLSVNLFISCKDESNKKNNDQETESVDKTSKNFTITLNATVLKDDSFQVFYKSKDESVYADKNSQFTEFKGSNLPQDIVFELPEGVIPDNIRLDFGTNKDQADIKINSFKISFYGNTFEAKGSDFFNYMNVDLNTAKVDKIKGIINPETVNGVYDPQAVSEGPLYEQIQKIIK